ncbi:MAG: NUDIX hydrolase [Ignisphaera sp.]|uniref:NUDIX domain-containing protein n=1 Tax=Ignisphaera aggregans TaxID=334771 RepID=A0A7C4NLG3_9CREN
MSREYPQHVITAVGAILVSDGRILLIKRGSQPGKGLWSIPGGAMEVGESIFDAARRELYEETGIDAKPLGVISVVNLIVRDKEFKPKYHYVILGVLFDEESVLGSLKPGGDALDISFLPLEQALNENNVSKTTKALVAKLIGNNIEVIEVDEVSFFEQS